MKDIKELIESLQSLIEEDVQEEQIVDVQDTEEPETNTDVPFDDTMSLVDQLDARTKIARSLETLKNAVEEFKDATSEKVDFLQDNLLLQSIEQLDSIVNAITEALANGSSILGETSANDVFKTELPAIDENPKEEPEEVAEEGQTVKEEEDENFDFDQEAKLDLLNP